MATRFSSRPPIISAVLIVAIAIVANARSATIDDDRGNTDPMESGYSETVYACDFEDAHDVNYDGWPDGWTRRRGRDYPHYLPVEIHPDPQNPPGRALRIDLDGGAATVYSPTIAVSPLFSYVLEARVRTSGLTHDVASISVSLLNDEGKELESFESPLLQGVESWTNVRVGPFTPTHPETRRAVLALHLRPTSGLPDLSGSAWFDDLWFARLPRMVVRANSEYYLYDDPSQVEITCNVSGMGRKPPELTAELLDVDGRTLATESLQLEGGLVSFQNSSTEPMQPQPAGGGSGPAGTDLAQEEDIQGAFAGTATWRPPVPGNGFYRVHVSMRGPQGRVLERTLNLAVISPAENRPQGEFGWSLMRGERPFGVNALLGLLGRVGVNWIKFPAWFSDQEGDRADRLAWFAERLTAQSIEMVGVLDTPPEAVREKFPDQDELSVAAVFLDPQVWQPVVDPVMVRLSLKVRYWQLGADEDASFIAFPNLAAKIGAIKSHLDQFGQKTRLGINWRWLYDAPENASPPWAFLSFDESLPFTPQELRNYLVTDHHNQSQNWVMIRPLPRRAYSMETRTRDLVGRMLAAKIGGATGIFATEPFDADTGLMTPDGTPTELFLPWRTTAQLIRGSQYIGRVVLPGGSENFIFARDGQAIMVVWNDRGASEQIYLGEDVRQVDVWGRESAVPVTTDSEGRRQQEVTVGPLPLFLTGLHLGIATWRMNFQFDKQQLSSVFGREQVASYSFMNSFPQGVGGKLKLHLPEVWGSNGNRDIPFKLAAGDRQTESFRVVLGTDASSGPQPVRIDFDLTADRRYRFSVYRTMEIGLGDVVVELSSRMDEDGNLVVEQQLINRTEEFVSFNCLLFAPQRRRERQQVVNMGQGRTTVTFVLPRGEELLGQKLWLRAEEIGGNRLLNYHLTAER